MSSPWLLVILAMLSAIARKWIDMAAETTGHRAARWLRDVARPRLALAVLLLAERIAIAGTAVMLDIKTVLAEHDAQRAAALDSERQGSGLALRWSLRLLARAATSRTAAVGNTANATTGSAAFGYATAWAILWYHGGHCVPMTTRHGYTTAAWIYSIPILALSMFTVVLMLVTTTTFAKAAAGRGLKRPPEPNAPMTAARAVRLFLQLGAAELVATLTRTVIDHPCAMLAYGMLAVLLLLVCRRHLGLRFAFGSVLLGAASGAISLLLLEAGGPGSRRDDRRPPRADRLCVQDTVTRRRPKLGRTHPKS